MKIGDRVRYVGVSRPEWHDIPAVITRVSSHGKFDVRFEREWTSTRFGATTVGTRGGDIPPSSLEIINMIDPTRPIQSTEDEPRPVRVIGVLERTVGVKTILLAVPWRGVDDNRPDGEVEIDLEGVPVRGSSFGAVLRFRNTPKRESQFYPLTNNGSLYANTFGRNDLSSVKRDFQSASFFVEIDTIDGVPAEAKIHAR